mmetsp:Transcript_28432/g.66704  ORF Transcript_28432/g.66704 Transcript_28432/m.66704 type:complete len:226 (-) Transcript_28432:365-1042(-)
MEPRGVDRNGRSDRGPGDLCGPLGHRLRRQEAGRGGLLGRVQGRPGARLQAPESPAHGGLQPRQGPAGRRQESHARNHRGGLPGAAGGQPRRCKGEGRPDFVAGKTLFRRLRHCPLVHHRQRRRRPVARGHGRGRPGDGRDGSHGRGHRFDLGRQRRNPQPGDRRRRVDARGGLRGGPGRLQRAFGGDIRQGAAGVADRGHPPLSVVGHMDAKKQNKTQQNTTQA